MDFEDYLEPEVGIAAAVVAVVASPRLRHVVRRGAVLGLAGALSVGDAVTSFARGLSHGARTANGGASAAEARVPGAPDQTAADSTVEAAEVTEEPSPSRGARGKRDRGADA